MKLMWGPLFVLYMSDVSGGALKASFAGWSASALLSVSLVIVEINKSLIYETFRLEAHRGGVAGPQLHAEHQGPPLAPSTPSSIAFHSSGCTPGASGKVYQRIQHIRGEASYIWRLETPMTQSALLR